MFTNTILYRITPIKSTTYPAIYRIGSGEHAAASVQLGVDAGLGDGDATLLHHLVDGRAVNVGHLVKLINADDSAVSQHHGSRLKASVTCGQSQLYNFFSGHSHVMVIASLKASASRALAFRLQ